MRQLRHQCTHIVLGTLIMRVALRPLSVNLVRAFSQYTCADCDTNQTLFQSVPVALVFLHAPPIVLNACGVHKCVLFIVNSLKPKRSRWLDIIGFIKKFACLTQPLIRFITISFGEVGLANEICASECEIPLSEIDTLDITHRNDISVTLLSSECVNRRLSNASCACTRVCAEYSAE